jgi:hypothetical protein
VIGCIVIRQKAISNTALGHGTLGAFSTFTQTLVNVNTEMAEARRGVDSKPWQY